MWSIYPSLDTNEEVNYWVFLFICFVGGGKTEREGKPISTEIDHVCNGQIYIQSSIRKGGASINIVIHTHMCTSWKW